MLSTFIIIFRETLEAMLVVGIALTAAKQAHISVRWIYFGMTIGIMTALTIAIFAKVISDSLSGMGQEVINATILLSAALLMVWTAIWMRQHGQEVSALIHKACVPDKGKYTAKWMLSAVVSLAVAREGSEIILFLYGVSMTHQNHIGTMIIGAILGLTLGLMLSITLYRSLIRIPMRYIFSVTTVFILVLAAGMASQGVSYLVMIDVLPAFGETIWNSSHLISEQSILGQTLHALMGYDDHPSGMQVFAFVAILSLSYLAIYAQTHTLHTQHLTLIILTCASVSFFPHHAEAKKIYSPIVEEGEVEIEYLLDYSVDTNPRQNNSARHQFELELGVNEHWMTAIYGDFRKRPNQTFAYQGLKWENIYQLWQQGEHDLDIGLYLEYIKPKRSLKKTDIIEIKLLFEKEQGHTVHTLNLVFKQALGSNINKNTLFAYAWRSQWRWKKELEPAIEIYGVLGEIGNTLPIATQTHQIGPVLLGQLDLGINYEIGYLFGLTSATDQGMLKFVLGYEL